MLGLSMENFPTFSLFVQHFNVLCGRYKRQQTNISYLRTQNDIEENITACKIDVNQYIHLRVTMLSSKRDGRTCQDPHKIIQQVFVLKEHGILDRSLALQLCIWTIEKFHHSKITSKCTFLLQICQKENCNKFHSTLDKRTVGRTISSSFVRPNLFCFGVVIHLRAYEV